MNVAHFPDDAVVKWNQPVLALGNFDGLHRGHMKIIDRVRRRAGERGGMPAVMTFDPHPDRVLWPDRERLYLTTLDARLRLLESLRIEHTIVLPFDQNLAKVPAEEFMQRVCSAMDGAEDGSTATAVTKSRKALPLLRPAAFPFARLMSMPSPPMALMAVDRKGLAAKRAGSATVARSGGAGEGNRTLVVSLGSSCSTIELHPHRGGIIGGVPEAATGPGAAWLPLAHEDLN